jgi:hypothetical protein
MMVASSIVLGGDTVSEKPRSGEGFGGYPLTDSVTSMWAAVSEPASDTEKILTFLIYFRGAPGWHQGKWRSNATINQDPAVVEFSKEGISLRAQFSWKSKMLSVFGKDIPITRANVVFVDQVDQPGKEIVQELGELDLRFPLDAIPAVYIVQHSKRIELALFGGAK